MEGRKLTGRTIKRVHQVNWQSTGKMVWVLDAIEFTDGTWLRFVVAEGEGDYGVVGVYPGKAVA